MELDADHTSDSAVVRVVLSPLPRLATLAYPIPSKHLTYLLLSRFTILLYCCCTSYLHKFCNIAYAPSMIQTGLQHHFVTRADLPLALPCTQAMSNAWLCILLHIH